MLVMYLTLYVGGFLFVSQYLGPLMSLFLLPHQAWVTA